jgi:hypothetical protein
LCEALAAELVDEARDPASRATGQPGVLLSVTMSHPRGRGVDASGGRDARRSHPGRAPRRSVSESTRLWQAWQMRAPHGQPTPLAYSVRWASRIAARTGSRGDVGQEQLGPLPVGTGQVEGVRLRRAWTRQSRHIPLSLTVTSAAQAMHGPIVSNLNRQLTHG